jgi:hypothetical protein
MAHNHLVIYFKNILWSKKNVYVGIVLNKFPNIIKYIFNVWRKIIDYLNARIIYSPFVYSKIRYGLIKIELSCTVH